MPPPTLDLDREVEMLGGDNEGGEVLPYNESECVKEPTRSSSNREHVIETQDNEIDMKVEGGTGEKRGKPEYEERSSNGKLRRREGIKRSLRDITPVSYEEYEESWDLEDQSKKCKRAVNCLLASCDCRGESGPIREEEGNLPVDLPESGETETGGRDSTDTAARNTPCLGNRHSGRYSDSTAGESATQTAGNSNHTSSTVTQLVSKPRRVQSSWSKRLFRTMITLMLLLTSVWKVDGSTGEDWRESVFKIHSFDCSTPTMINKLHLPEVCFIPEQKLAVEVAPAQPAWILGDLDNIIHYGRVARMGKLYTTPFL